MINKIDDIVIRYDDEVLKHLTLQDLKPLVAEEEASFEAMKKELGMVEFKVVGDELEICSRPLAKIVRLRRITGYLSDINNFNKAKAAELRDRVMHA